MNESGTLIKMLGSTRFLKPSTKFLTSKSQTNREHMWNQTEGHQMNTVRRIPIRTKTALYMNRSTQKQILKQKQKNIIKRKRSVKSKELGNNELPQDNSHIFEDKAYKSEPTKKKFHDITMISNLVGSWNCSWVGTNHYILTAKHSLICKRMNLSFMLGWESNKSKGAMKLYFGKHPYFSVEFTSEAVITNNGCEIIHDSMIDCRDFIKKYDKGRKRFGRSIDLYPFFEEFNTKSMQLKGIGFELVEISGNKKNVHHLRNLELVFDANTLRSGSRMVEFKAKEAIVTFGDAYRSWKDQRM